MYYPFFEKKIVSFWKFKEKMKLLLLFHTNNTEKEHTESKQRQKPF